VFFSRINFLTSSRLRIGLGIIRNGELVAVEDLAYDHGHSGYVRIQPDAPLADAEASPGVR